MHPCLFGLFFSYFLADKIKLEILLLQTASPAILHVVLIAIFKSFFAVRFISTVNSIRSLRADEIKLWLTNQSLVIVCTQATQFAEKKNGGGKFRKGPNWFETPLLESHPPPPPPIRISLNKRPTSFSSSLSIRPSYGARGEEILDFRF